MRRKSDIDPKTVPHNKINDRFRSPQLSKSKSRNKIRPIAGMRGNDRKGDTAQEEHSITVQNVRDTYDVCKYESSQTSKSKNVNHTPQGLIYLPKNIKSDKHQSNYSSTNQTMVIKPSVNSSYSGGFNYYPNSNQHQGTYPTRVLDSKGKKPYGSNIATSNAKINRIGKSYEGAVKSKEPISKPKKKNYQKTIMLVLNQSAAKIQKAWRRYYSRKVLRQIRNRKRNRLSQGSPVQNFNSHTVNNKFQVQYQYKDNIIQRNTRRNERQLLPHHFRQDDSNTKCRLKSMINNISEISAEDSSLHGHSSCSQGSLHNAMSSTESQNNLHAQFYGENFKEHGQRIKLPTKMLKRQFEEDQETPGRTPMGKDEEINYNNKKYYNQTLSIAEYQNDIGRSYNAAQNKKAEQITGFFQKSEKQFEKIKINQPKIMGRQFVQDQLIKQRIQMGHIQSAKALQPNNSITHQINVSKTVCQGEQKPKAKLSFKPNLYHVSVMSSSISLTPKRPNSKPYQQSYPSQQMVPRHSLLDLPSYNHHSFSGHLKASIEKVISDCKSSLQQGKISKLLSLQGKFRQSAITERSYQNTIRTVSKEYEQKLKMLQWKQQQIIQSWKGVIQIYQQLYSTEHLTVAQSNRQSTCKKNQLNYQFKKKSSKVFESGSANQEIVTFDIQQATLVMNPQSIVFRNNMENLKQQTQLQRINQKPKSDIRGEFKSYQKQTIKNSNILVSDDSIDVENKIQKRTVREVWSARESLSPNILQQNESSFDKLSPTHDDLSNLAHQHLGVSGQIHCKPQTEPQHKIANQEPKLRNHVEQQSNSKIFHLIGSQVNQAAIQEIDKSLQKTVQQTQNFPTQKGKVYKVNEQIQEIIFNDIVNEFFISLLQHNLKPQVLFSNLIRAKGSNSLTRIEQIGSPLSCIESQQLSVLGFKTQKQQECLPSIIADCESVNNWLLDISHFILDNYHNQLRNNLVHTKIHQPGPKQLCGLIRNHDGDSFESGLQVIPSRAFEQFQHDYKKTIFNMLRVPNNKAQSFYKMLHSFHSALYQALNLTLLEELRTGRHWITLPFNPGPRFLQQKLITNEHAKRCLERAINRVSNWAQYCVSPLNTLGFVEAGISQLEWKHHEEQKANLVPLQEVFQTKTDSSFWNNWILIEIADNIWQNSITEAIEDLQQITIGK